MYSNAHECLDALFDVSVLKHFSPSGVLKFYTYLYSKL